MCIELANVTSRSFSRIIPRHFDVSAKGKQAYAVIGIATLYSEETAAEAERESFDADATELGNDKVAELVNEYEKTQNNGEANAGNKKMSHISLNTAFPINLR